MSSNNEMFFNFRPGLRLDGLYWSSLLLLATGLPLTYFCLLRPVYHVFFHPLARYPGPKIFAASSIPWGIYFMSGHWHHKLMELHNKYGPIVRVGPDELSYSDPEAWDDIYGRHVAGKRKENGKPEWYTGPSDHDISGASLGDHGRMRRLLNPGFTQGAMYKYEPLIKQHIDVLIRQLHEQAQGSNAEVDMLEWFTFCTFDIIGDLAFGEPFGCLRESQMHPYIKLLNAGNYIANIMIICKRLPIFYMFLPLKASLALYKNFKEHSEFLRQTINRRLGKQSMRCDFLDMMTTTQGNLCMTEEEILKNAQLLTSAGSETTSSALAGLVYVLTTVPHIKEKIMEELHSSFSTESEIDMRSVANLSYLQAVAKELLRYYPPGPNAFWRITPPEGNIILGEQIPGHTIIGVPHRVVYRNPKYWHRPDEFLPERWLPAGQNGEFINDRIDGFHPFSYGPRSCIAINLAYTEMWYTLARVLWNFEMQVAPRSRDWMQDQQAYLIWEKPPLFIQLKQLEPHVDHLNNAEKTKGRHQMQLGNEGRIPKAPGTLKIVQELHPRFGAEVSGVNFSKSISDEVFEHILRAIAKYGVLVFRSTGLDDAGHIEFARRFGDLLDMRQYIPKGRKTRLDCFELADLSNIDAETGKLIPVDSSKASIANATAYFHADLSYSQQRATFCLLKATKLPPPEYGGDTVFSDTRTAFEEVDDIEPGLKRRLLARDFVGAHSWQHLQKTSNPQLYKELAPLDHPMAKHKVVQLHEPSGRMALYIGSYMHHIEGTLEEEQELALLQENLMHHALQEKYQMRVQWENPGDMILWDNRAVMHKAGPGTFAGKFVRDLRRATVLEASN